MLAEVMAVRTAPELSSISEGLRPSGDSPDGLSDREVAVLRYLPTMLTAGDIAAELGVSVNTIKAHMRSIYHKLGASRRQEIVVRAYERGIL
jgi:LuxR family maltose regulon positive regulatory protein